MSYDYKSKYKCKIFGIKKINRFFAVEETNLFEDLSKYDFVMNDCIAHDDCNGNVNFRADVMKEACDDPIFNGWKLENLYFYGNWYGQAPAYNLIDKFGDSYHSPQLTNKRKRYEQQPEVMIRETLLEVLKFTETHYFVRNDVIIKGFDIPTGTISLKQYQDFNETVSLYIENYQKVLSSLQETGADDDTVKQLKQQFNTQIRKCYPFNIDVSKLST